MSQNTPYTIDRIFRIFLTFLLFSGIFFLLKILSGVLLPFMVAVLLAYLIDPLVQFIQFKMRLKNRVLSVVVALIVVFGSVAALLTYLIPVFSAEMHKMTILLIEYAQKVDYQYYMPDAMRVKILNLITTTDIHSLISFEKIASVFQESVKHSWNFVSETVSVIMSIVSFLIIFMYLIFLLIDYDHIAQGWKTLIPKQYNQTVVTVIDDLTKAMNIYFRAQGLIAAIVGVLLAIGFSVINLPMAIILGLFIGLLNMVPYLQIAGFIPALIMALLKSMENGTSFWHEALLVFIVIGVVQLIQDIYLTPKIMGKVYGMHPAVILLSLSIWGSLLGLFGMLIALPLTTVLFSYFKRYVLKPTDEDAVIVDIREVHDL